MGRLVTLEELKALADAARNDLFAQAKEVGRDPKIYLHWTAGRYDTDYPDYHICITGEGKIVLMAPLTETLPHTWHRNSGAIGIALDCAYGATSGDLGDYPPTGDQIEAMAQVVAVLAKALWLTIDRDRVLTHAEAADNIDGLLPEGDEYGPNADCERWDLQYLGTPDSPAWTTDYDDPRTGGNVLRGKANWYRQQFKARMRP